MKQFLKISVVFVSTLLVLSGCREELKPSSTKNYISGKIDGITGGEKILLQSLLTNEINVIDTILPDMEGNFEIAPEIEGLGYYRVFVSNNNFFNFITQPAETLKITANVNDLEGSYEVSGSDESNALADFNNMMNDYVAEMDSLRMEMQNAQARQNPQAAQIAYEAQIALNQQTAEKARLFVINNSTKLASISALQQFDPERDMDLFEKVLEDLKPVAGETTLYQEIAGRVEVAKRLMPGATFADLTSNTPEGNPLSLSQAMGEKYTLVDFWAAWCRPCRAENPVVVAAYNKYKSKGFEVFGVSLDKDAASWKQAILEDGLPWSQVSDLQFWDSPSAKQYNIRSIPANFLIDGDMKIVAKNLRGAELQARLAELLGE